MPRLFYIANSYALNCDEFHSGQIDNSKFFVVVLVLLAVELTAKTVNRKSLRCEFEIEDDKFQ